METVTEMESCDDESKVEFFRRCSKEQQDTIDKQRYLVDNLEFQRLEVRSF